jgi:hypothetical protein
MVINGLSGQNHLSATKPPLTTMPPIGHPLSTTLLEAFRAATALLRPTLHSSFILIGGAALLSLGGTRSTDDVDVAITTESLHAFYAAALLSPLFKKSTMDLWEYTSPTTGLVVPFEFLLQGAGFAPIIAAPQQIPGGGGLRAGVGELVVMKARAWCAREEESDLEVLRFCLGGWRPGWKRGCRCWGRKRGRRWGRWLRCLVGGAGRFWGGC